MKTLSLVTGRTCLVAIATSVVVFRARCLMEQTVTKCVRLDELLRVSYLDVRLRL